MPATATAATRAHPAATATDPQPPLQEERDAEALDWPEVARLLAATDDDDVPLFGRLPA